MPNDRELGLDTLLAAKTDLGVALDDKFLEACFKIQQKYQFSEDRKLSIAAMDRLIDKQVKKASEKAIGDEA